MTSFHKPQPQAQATRSSRSICQSSTSIEESQNHRLKPGHHCGGQFWTSLSRIHLTHRAPKALDRRTQASLTRNPSHDDGVTSGDITRQTYIKIRSFARRGGPDLADLRGFSRMLSHTRLRRSPRLHKSSQSRTAYQLSPAHMKQTPSTITPYSANFRQRMVDKKIMSRGEPQDWDETNTRLARPRASLSPQMGDSIYRGFRRACDEAMNEATLRETGKPFIEGTRQAHYGAAEVLFNNLAPIDTMLSRVKPDWYDGARPKTIPQQVRSDLSDLIMPSTRPNMPAAPNFFSEWKSDAGQISVAQNQVCHDSVIGARAMHALQNYGAARPQYDGHAYCLSTTFQDGQLKVYSTHIQAPDTAEAQPAYHTAQQGAFAITHNAERFREGVAAYRNARDYAAEKRDLFIARTRAVEEED